MSSDRALAESLAKAQPAERATCCGGAGPALAGGSGQASPAAVLERQVLRPLLLAMQDYTTNDRGDVGSWVRIRMWLRLWPCCVLDEPGAVSAELSRQGRLSMTWCSPQVRAAAMAALAQLLPLWAAHRRRQSRHPRWPFDHMLNGTVAYERKMPCSSSAGQQLLPSQQQADDRREPAGTASVECEAPAASAALDAHGVAGEVAAALLKQACERIDRLRRVSAIW